MRRPYATKRTWGGEGVAERQLSPEHHREKNLAKGRKEMKFEAQRSNEAGNWV